MEEVTHLLDLAAELLPMLLTGLTHMELARACQSCQALRRAVAEVSQRRPADAWPHPAQAEHDLQGTTAEAWDAQR